MIYLSVEELKLLLDWFDYKEMEVGTDAKDNKLFEKIKRAVINEDIEQAKL